MKVMAVKAVSALFALMVSCNLMLLILRDLLPWPYPSTTELRIVRCLIFMVEVVLVLLLSINLIDEKENWHPGWWKVWLVMDLLLLFSAVVDFVRLVWWS